jgi:hypothetical protein
MGSGDIHTSNGIDTGARERSHFERGSHKMRHGILKGIKSTTRVKRVKVTTGKRSTKL